MSNSTLDRLEELLAEVDQEDQEEARYIEREPHTRLNQELITLFLIDHPDRVDISLFEPADFDDLSCQLIVAYVKNHHEKFQQAPTRRTLRAYFENAATVDDPWYPRVEELLTARLDPRETPYIIKYLKDWQKARIKDQMRFDPHADYAECYRRLTALDAPPDTKFNFRPLNELIRDRKDPVWLCEGILTEGQPFVLAGPKKCLKTALLCDLALALAAGTEFLGQFAAPTTSTVGFFSAESGDCELVRRFESILAARGIQAPENLYVSFESPKLSDPEDLAGIARFIKDRRIKVMIIDPMYLTLLTGNSEINAANVLQMGPVLRGVSSAILAEGATPILCHHTKKTLARGKDLNLDDLSYSGFAEFCRQSLLVWRRQEMAGPHDNKLSLKTHGFMRAACYNLDVDETTWTVAVTPREVAYRSRGRDEREKKKERVLEAITTLEEQGEATSKRNLAAQAGVSGGTLNKILGELFAEGLVRPLVRDGKVVGLSRRDT